VLQVYYFFKRWFGLGATTHAPAAVRLARTRETSSAKIFSPAWVRRDIPSRWNEGVVCLETSPATTPFASFWATLGRRSAMAGKSWLSDFAKDGLPNAIAVSSMDY
jgi:hypothetical protein